MMRPLPERLWALVDKPDDPAGCWLFRGKRYGFGHGRIKVGTRSMFAHRVSWMLTFGDPGGSCVLHRCDVPACVNPDHLFLGSRVDNVIDMDQKGRRKPSAVKVYEDYVPRRNALATRRSRQRAARGVCTHCLRPAPAGFRRCERCRESAREAWNRRPPLRSGVCSGCGRFFNRVDAHAPRCPMVNAPEPYRIISEVPR